jgi:hypothetical protein
MSHFDPEISQLSDAGPSSHHDGDADNLSFALSDDAYLYTPEPPSSQSTLTSVPSSPFIRSLAASVPQSLERVGPDKKKNFVRYTTMTNSEFLEWWFQTTAAAEGKKASKSGKKDKKAEFDWDGIKNHAESWGDFDQVANIHTGIPRVMCKKCGTILDHPNWKGNGTKSINRHPNTEACKKAGTQKGQQAKIRQLFKSAVSTIS